MTVLTRGLKSSAGHLDVTQCVELGLARVQVLAAVPVDSAHWDGLWESGQQHRYAALNGALGAWGQHSAHNQVSNFLSTPKTLATDVYGVTFLLMRLLHCSYGLWFKSHETGLVPHRWVDACLLQYSHKHSCQEVISRGILESTLLCLQGTDRGSQPLTAPFCNLGLVSVCFRARRTSPP